MRLDRLYSLCGVRKAYGLGLGLGSFLGRLCPGSLGLGFRLQSFRGGLVLQLRLSSPSFARYY